jgi:hypothetical protein
MERDHMEDLKVDGRIMIKFIFNKWDVEAWAGSLWVRVGTGGEPL